jgi:hypothetical protein
MKNAVLFSVVAVVLVGCYPVKQVNTIDDRPGIYVVDAPAGAILYIDGIEMGRAAKFDGNPTVLLVEPGTHRLKIVNDGVVLLSSEVFLGEGVHRKITLPSSGQ